MPWIHQFVDAQGSIKPCCVYDFKEELGSLKENTLEEIWNNDKTKELRLTFLNGQQDSACFRCFNRGPSLRTGQNDHYLSQQHIQEVISSTKEDGSVPEHKLYYMDVRFNNLCNLSCRTCSPHFSTSWILDHRKLYNITPETAHYHTTVIDNYHFPGKTENQALEEILPHLETIDYVYFAGGEPLMQKEHYVVLERLIELKKFDTKIRYNTNFSKLITNKIDVIDYWKQFTDLTIHSSIDGSYSKGEYWRKGTIWKDIVSNRQRLLNEVPHAKFAINYTVSWPSILNMLELHREWVELGLSQPEELIANCLDQPSYYSIKNIPVFKKQQIEKAFFNHIEWLLCLGLSPNAYVITALQDVIRFMYAEEQQVDVDTSLLEFKKITDKLDEIRTESFYDVYPEHLDIKAYINGLI
jgi:organic radical activating enzyme